MRPLYWTALSVVIFFLAILGFFLLPVPTNTFFEQFQPTVSTELPNIVFMSIYMGKLQDKYSHLPMWLESIRRNPKVDFVLININSNINGSNFIIELRNKMRITNLLIKPLTISEFRSIVKDRLGIDVPFTYKWFYKLCDYKPTLAHLFPELSSEAMYQYWGYGDIDVVWGNFSHFSRLFQGRYHFVNTGHCVAIGPAVFFLNGNWSKTFFQRDKLYIPLLKNLSYHNLDESGLQTDPENVVHEGQHSIAQLQYTYIAETGVRMNPCGKHYHGQLMYDPGDSTDWAGPMQWKDGSLKILSGSYFFPPDREVLFYHRILPLNFPEDMRYEIFREMADNGVLLPSWRPLVTRFACDELSLRDFSHTLDLFQPTKDCLKPSNVKRLRSTTSSLQY